MKSASEKVEKGLGDGLVRKMPVVVNRVSIQVSRKMTINIRRYIYAVIIFYVICIALGFSNTTGFLGWIGRAPVPFLGDKASIKYMYECSSYDNYDKFWKGFWMKKGAEAGIPEFQRLYGGKLFDSNQFEGLRMLTKAAEANDYHAALELALLYDDPRYSFRNQELAMKFKLMADALELKQSKPLQ